MKNYFGLLFSVFLLAFCNITFAQVSAADKTTSGKAEANKNTQQATITISGSGPFYRLNLPVSIYPTATHVDLRDLRIRNASGDFVPHAWIDNDVAAPQLFSTAAVFYPIAVRNNNDTKDQTDLSFEFKQNPDGSLLKIQTKKITQEAINNDWIVDVSQIKGSLLQARFTLDETVNGLFSLSIDASDDLHHWHAINSDEQIAVLKQQNGKIEKLTVDLYSARTNFLRLHWRDATPVVTIKTIIIDSVQQNNISSPLQWSEAISATNCTENYCDYLLPAKTPIDSLRINLSEPNTLAEVNVYGQLPMQVSAYFPHRHRPLYVLRHKRQPPASAIPAEVMVTKTLVYRLTHGSEELHSDSLEMDGSIYTHLRLQTLGPITLLGKLAPSIEVASTPRSLIFLGRGPAPFSLFWGTEEAQGNALELSTLVPGYQPNTPVNADNASVDIPLPTKKLIVTSAPSNELPKSKHAQPQNKKLWLWTVLAGGMLLLIGMAWSLFSGMEKSKQ